MKVTKKVYTDIKRTIKTLNEEGRVPTHQERKRSRKRKDMYTELGKWHGVSYDTVHTIGLSKSYNNYRALCSKYKPKQKLASISVPLFTTPISVKKAKNTEVNELKELRKALAMVEATHTAELQKIVPLIKSDFVALQEEVTALQTEMAIIKAKKGRWFHNA